MKPLTLMESLRQPIGRWTAQRLLTTGFVLSVATLLVTGGSSYLQIRTLIRDRVAVLHSSLVLDHIDLALILMSDVEAGQRGYLITGDESYLDHYRASLPYLRSLLTQEGRVSHVCGLCGVVVGTPIPPPCPR